jgi:hypothetical protein
MTNKPITCAKPEWADPLCLDWQSQILSPTDTNTEFTCHQILFSVYYLVSGDENHAEKRLFPKSISFVWFVCIQPHMPAFVYASIDAVCKRPLFLLKKLVLSPLLTLRSKYYEENQKHIVS